MASVVVIGGGVGGLVAAIRLRNSGHDVVVYEAKKLGGKLASVEVDGFRFDTGPSLLTLPDVFRELFADCGRNVDDYVNLVRLEQPFRHNFVDGSTLDVFDEPARSRESFERLSGSGAEWDAMRAHGKRVWDISERTFFIGEMDSPLSLLRRMKSPFDLLNIDSLHTLDSRSRKLFTDSRLQAWMNRFATYSGSSPYLAPATLACIAHVEQEFGCWHVEGGLGELSAALVKLAEEVGVELHEGTPVVRVLHDYEWVDSVVLVNGERIETDVVVSNVNAERLYTNIIPAYSDRLRAQRAGRSTSVLALCLGLDGTSDTAHHNLWYSADQKREFDEIFDGTGVPSDPTIYMCNASATDASMAPPGSEAWFGLVNVRSGATHDWERYADGIVDRLGIGKRARVRRLITPQRIEANYGDPGGSIYGTSSNGRRSAFLRALNKGPIGGLYLCGGSAHPGGGVPLAAMSGRIVANMVNRELTA